MPSLHFPEDRDHGHDMPFVAMVFWPDAPSLYHLLCFWRAWAVGVTWK